MSGNRSFRPDEPTGMSAEDRTAIVDSLASEMRELFHGYLSGEYGFEELTFEMFDTLQTLHALATGNFSIEWISEDEVVDDSPSERFGDDGTGRGRENRKKGDRRREH